MLSTPASPRVRRCLATLRCESVDRAPGYIPAIACSVASELLGRPAHTGTGSLRFAEVAAWADGEAAHAEFVERMIEDLVAVHRALEAGVLRMPWRMNARPDARIDEHTFRFGPEDGEHSIWQYQPASADFSPVYQSPRVDPPEVRLRRELERLERPGAHVQASARAEAASTVDLWRRYGGEFLVVGAGVLIGAGLEPEDLELLALEPDLVRRRCLWQAELAIATGRALKEAGCPAVILGGGDLAGNQGPFYSPAMFRQAVLPGYTQALDELNRMGAHYVFRSDGNLGPLMAMIFEEAACPGYGETDRDAAMTVAAVRAQFPRLVIWGNVSSQLLMQGTAGEVRAQAQAALAEAGGRGYFQGCSNAIVQGTPVANVYAMFGAR